MQTQPILAHVLGLRGGQQVCHVHGHHYWHYGRVATMRVNEEQKPRFLWEIRTYRIRITHVFNGEPINFNQKQM